ncbi:hydroxymethylglutaryl-CoA synthase family protein [Alloalcanivorax mobilis]|uniref:hydroxymethylglutaryl-CoA synthase family protein n=1 Tax=Alloalcanivorax mobilis TaxID=2019569 RepID=UPI000C78EAD7|nr:3-oxoacyl-[acyl-carrier-protein] synthase III C-terminal domain-containing protein [Alloalcanivorax mobilis]|tara:strand:- start:29211 stop:30689 length:1479 start_codon:yes stop_codon:yes gene_type:complete
MIGIVGYGAYLPRLRLSRRAVFDANAWYAPQFAGKARGHRTMANWDEDSVTMAVAAARDCLGPGDDRSRVRALALASSSLPFAERLNAGIVAEALTLDERVLAQDVTGSQRVALSALAQALAAVRGGQGETLLLAADNRQTSAASAAELDYGDGAAAVLLGSDGVLAEYLGGAHRTVDFVDRFRRTGESIDYHWEERWVRDEGIDRQMPEVIAEALTQAGVEAAAVDHFIFPAAFAKVDTRLAARCGIPPEAVVDNLAERAGNTGVAHGLLLLAGVLQRARPGQIVLLTQFGNGGEALVFRVTEAIDHFRPVVGLEGWLERGREETAYTRFLSFQGRLHLERGMRGEQDKKTALTTLYRHRRAILGLVAGRCRETGEVHFPPSRISYTPGKPVQDSQESWKLAERQGRVLSWSAEYLSWHMSPPHQYGQVDFDGGGRILMDFTDVERGDISSGCAVEMVFRIKDTDETRGFNRYFWKATPLRDASQQPEKSE